MTKKDFELIADIVGTLTWDDPETVRAHKAGVVANRLAGTNPRFDKDRFVKAALAVKH